MGDIPLHGEITDAMFAVAEAHMLGLGPVRIQLSRRKGWRMPPNTVSVARPTKWGNRWTVADYRAAGFRPSDRDAAETCVWAFRAWMLGEKHWAHGCNEPAPPDASELRGKNLACWCKIGEPCHADVLLELANGDRT